MPVSRRRPTTIIPFAARKRRARRDYVLNRMAEDGYISLAAAAAEMAGMVRVRPPSTADAARADYFVEEVRRKLQGTFGERGLYGGGLSVRTTLNSELQRIADTSLRWGLSAYDRRHGWRGPLGRVDATKDWRSAMSKFALPSDVDHWRTAVVLALQKIVRKLVLQTGRWAHYRCRKCAWARRFNKQNRPAPETVG